MVDLKCVESAKNDLVKQLDGELLTLLEAIIPEAKKCEAAKSLVKQCVHRNADRFLDMSSKINKQEEKK